MGSRPRPFQGIDPDITDRWKRAPEELLAGDASSNELPLDHAARPLSESGGYESAKRRLRRILHERVDRYGTERNDPDAEAGSELCNQLRFGHISSRQILEAAARRGDGTPWRLSDQTSPKCRGGRTSCARSSRQ